MTNVATALTFLETITPAQLRWFPVPNQWRPVKQLIWAIWRFEQIIDSNLCAAFVPHNTDEQTIDVHTVVWYEFLILQIVLQDVDNEWTFPADLIAKARQHIKACAPHISFDSLPIEYARTHWIPFPSSVNPWIVLNKELLINAMNPNLSPEASLGLTLMFLITLLHEHGTLKANQLPPPSNLHLQVMGSFGCLDFRQLKFLTALLEEQTKKARKSYSLNQAKL